MSTEPHELASTGSGVRRHHTITAASRTAHAGGRPISQAQDVPEAFDTHDEDEVVDQDWVGGVGAVGEKSSSLHRQASLPTKYHRGE
jgi:YTH domain-containing family protein